MQPACQPHLVIAPMIDAISGRHIRWFSWVALGLSILCRTDRPPGPPDGPGSVVA
jgi:hypothetical protein